VPENIASTSEEAFDPLPDETVLKTGWLSKKGRRGVFVPVIYAVIKGRTGRDAGLCYAQTGWRIIKTREYHPVIYHVLALQKTDILRNTRR
jgi:hypothetical protein